MFTNPDCHVISKSMKTSMGQAWNLTNVELVNMTSSTPNQMFISVLKARVERIKPTGHLRVVISFLLQLFFGTFAMPDLDVLLCCCCVCDVSLASRCLPPLSVNICCLGLPEFALRWRHREEKNTHALRK